MTAPKQPNSLDIPFSVPFVHRLRFTDNVWTNDARTLIDLLEPSGDRPPRVQFWLDENLNTADPALRSTIESFCGRAGNVISSVGPIQSVPGGEAIKNDIHILERMLKVMHAARLDRRSYVVVVGGGAVLDAVGFAAAIAHRGIRLIRLPTTTLAQADSGIGVKNSVNLFQKKNWIGTFAVPWGVINDSSMLSSLSDRDFVCGFSEAVKVALLKKAPLFQRIEQAAEAIRSRAPEAAAEVIRESARLHLEHITRGGDPFEVDEARPLDFGHWSAHRLEALSDFRLRHGEAVAIGVAIDTVYSSLVHGLPAQDMNRVITCLLRLGFNLSDPILADTDAVLDGLEEFRQHLGGQLTLTMLSQIGQSFEIHDVDRAQMCCAIRKVTGFSYSEGCHPEDWLGTGISQKS